VVERWRNQRFEYHQGADTDIRISTPRMSTEISSKRFFHLSIIWPGWQPQVVIEQPVAMALSRTGSCLWLTASLRAMFCDCSTSCWWIGKNWARRGPTSRHSHRAPWCTPELSAHRVLTRVSYK
jgi:hypothetical protein